MYDVFIHIRHCIYQIRVKKSSQQLLGQCVAVSCRVIHRRRIRGPRFEWPCDAQRVAVMRCVAAWLRSCSIFCRAFNLHGSFSCSCSCSILAHPRTEAGFIRVSHADCVLHYCNTLQHYATQSAFSTRMHKKLLQWYAHEVIYTSDIRMIHVYVAHFVFKNYIWRWHPDAHVHISIVYSYVWHDAFVGAIPQDKREPHPEAAVSLRKMVTFVTWPSSRTEFLV